MFAEKIKWFLKLEASGGIILFGAGLLAMLLANSPFKGFYDIFLETPVVFQFGALEIAKPLLLWINDGLMAVFFFLIGLELKREFLAGELSEPSKVVLPVVAAIGGMAIPALVYAYINWGDSNALNGWAIPAATDIAFALGVLAILGSRVPVSLKVFLATLSDN
jgi:NhaA family Na+:H+ antiporter